jgi:hypothetical protein
MLSNKKTVSQYLLSSHHVWNNVLKLEPGETPKFLRGNPELFAQS